MKKLMFVMVVTLMSALQVSAQNAKIADNTHECATGKCPECENR